MNTDLIIAPVRRRRLREAIRFLVGGQQRDESVRARADALIDTVRKRGLDSVALWWARRRRACVAAAMIFANPGRTGLLFYGPLDAPGVDAEAMVSLVRAVTDDQLRHGLWFVQCLVVPDAEEEVRMVRAAGYRLLADLIYMRGELTELAAPDRPQPDDLAWRDGLAFSDQTLGEVIAATYEDSLDCPLIAGRRSMADVIEGHKFSGGYHRASWWIVDVSGAPAGCILVNDSRAPGAVEVVYVGVVRRFRGRGLGRAMLAHAARQAKARGKEALTLTVDAANVYAMRLYESMGLARTDRRLSYVSLPESESAKSRGG